MINLVHFKEFMNKHKILDPHDVLLLTKETNNLTISELSSKTKVNRDIIKRFLNGHKINHIDYLKIVKVYPEIQKIVNPDKNFLQAIEIDMFGTIIDNGLVRGLYLNESTTFLFVDNLKRIFTRDMIGLHNKFSNNKHICLYTKKQSFSIDDLNYHFLVKTETNCYYGVVHKYKSDYVLCSTQDNLPIQMQDKKIIEIYELIAIINNRWSELKDEKFFTTKKEKNTLG